MMADVRTQNEDEFLALLLKNEKLIDITNVKPEHLGSSITKKMFKYIKECYEEYGVVSLVKMNEKHKDINAFDVDYFVKLSTETIYYKDFTVERLKLCESMIIKYYKEDVIKYFNNKLVNGNIKYEDFVKNIKKLDDIAILETTKTLTEEEIIKGINEENSLIQLKNFRKLSDMLKLVQGDFLIIGATTGAGKSGFMLNLMNDLMERYQCIYFNMEMSKSTIYKRIVSINSKIKINDIVKPQTAYQNELIISAIKRVGNANLIIEHKASDIKEIKRSVAKLKDKDKHTILFIDHLGLTKCDGMKSLYEQATEVAKQLRQICLEYDCTIISASQLNRTAYTNDEVTLNMLKDSGELENSASKVILLNRNKNSDKDSPVVNMNVNIAKNRDGFCGNVEMIYDKTNQVFEEVKNERY